MSESTYETLGGKLHNFKNGPYLFHREFEKDLKRWKDIKKAIKEWRKKKQKESDELDE